MKIENKKEVLLTLMSAWIHLGSARDNAEQVDCDSLQEQLHAVGNFLQELWQVDYEGDSTKYGCAVKEPGRIIVDVEKFLVHDDGTTEYEESRRSKKYVS